MCGRTRLRMGWRFCLEDYKVPYSMYHDDPPEVRLANEIAGRKANLEAELKKD